MKTWIALAGATSLIISTNLLAAPEINFNGFLTAGGLFTDTDKATFLNTGKDANFQPDSVVGLQLNMPVNTDASVTVQLTARGNNDFKSDVEWAFLTYSLAENTDLRLGRLRIPFFMISDYLDVGYAYPWVRPPIDVYGQLAFSRYNGINLLSLQQWGDWSASIQGLFGSTSLFLTNI